MHKKELPEILNFFRHIWRTKTLNSSEQVLGEKSVRDFINNIFRAENHLRPERIEDVGDDILTHIHTYK